MAFKHLTSMGLVALSLAGVAGEVEAQGLLPGAGFSISCGDGGNYVLESGPAAAPGDIVTARLRPHGHHAVPVRLVPMGDGYRYIGRGIWLDGIRDRALLYRSSYRPVACTVGRI